MTPHEDKMLDEIHQLQARLATAERSRLLWKALSILLCISLVAALVFLAIQYFK